MKAEDEKYNRVLNLIRNSKPALESTEDIENEVIKKITRVNRKGLNLSDIINFLFAWVYIGWVRRSLIGASIVLVLVFIYQQNIILRRIEVLSKQTVAIDKEYISTPADEIENLLTVYRNSGRRFPSRTVTISEKQMRELIKSVNELQIKYKDLESLIEEDPELKKLIEKKLVENNRTKINL
jgi:hypothetical protein